MTDNPPADIAFDQIKRGQTVRLHLTDGGYVEGLVADAGTDTAGAPYFYIGPRIAVAARLCSRAELLAERANAWRVGQLAEIDWSSSGCEGATRVWLARWDGEAWYVLDEGVRVNPGWIGPPRLMRPVPAGLPLLPGSAPDGKPWDAAVLDALSRQHEGTATGAVLRAVAEAVKCTELDPVQRSGIEAFQ